LRSTRIGAEGELWALQGGYIPFPLTPQARQSTGDPRPAVTERYRDYETYAERYLAAARQLVAERYLLEEDLPRLMRLCARFKPLWDQAGQ